MNKKSSPLVRFSLAFLFVALLIAGGTMGYSFIEGWSLSDSLYMTIITMTTVGFGEVRPLSDTGKHFTIVFLIFSIATLGYSATILIAFIFEGKILELVQERRMTRRIKRLKDHYIICGGGDIGREVALEFKRFKARFVVIDRDPENSELAREESVLFVRGEAEDDEVLKEASIERARGLVAVLPNDETNVFVVLTARQLNPSLTIVAKASEQRTTKKLQKAGANRIISPYQTAGRRMASFFLRPSVVSFLDVMVEGDLAMRIEEVQIDRGSPLIGKNLRETNIGQHTGAIIIGINGPDGRTRVNPSATALISTITLREGDVLIALGSEEQIGNLGRFTRHGK
ncbi:MAG TPA: NAD-binding protein [Spirochaetia bacterium]|nr:NAD-binding protein [Spirochaetia bacterium]